MAEKPGQRRQVMVPQEIWDKVQILANADFTSASSIVRKALTEYIRQRSKQAKKAKRERMAPV